MPESSDGTSPPPSGGGGANEGNNNRRSSDNRRNNGRGPNQRRQGNRHSRFEGECDDLKGAVYDVAAGRDTFMKTTRSIAEYVGRSYDDASDFRTGMVNLELPTVDAPEDPPDSAGAVRLELWKLARRRYELGLENRRKVNGRAYALVLGQCSQAVRNRLEAHADWNTINGGSDVIELLRLIQTCMTQRQTRKHPVHNIVDNEKTVLNFKQGCGMSDNDYYQRFQDAVDVAERAGGAVGVQEDRIIAELEHLALDPDVPTEEERSRATQIARDKYLAVLFLLNSDKRRYGTLVTNISNEFVRGNDTYPTTLTGAYDYIVNYTEINSSNAHGEEGGLSFYNEHDDGG